MVLGGLGMARPTARKTGAQPTQLEGGRDTMKIRPLHDRILVERLEEKEVKVIAVGNRKVGENGKKIALDVKAGDKILFGKYSGSEVKIDDKEYLILREEDVLAILE